MTHPRVRLGLAAFAVFLAAWPSAASAQTLYGSISGTVKDATGAAVPGALVQVKNVGTDQSQEMSTNEAGGFAFTTLLPGTYDLTVTNPGFRTYVEQAIPVAIAVLRRFDVALEVGQVTETITVEASGLALQTDKTDVSAQLPAQAVQNLPLNNYRNYQRLLDLVPGATPSRFQNAITDTPARSLTTNVNGVNRNNNNTKIDGATNIFIWLPHHTVYVPPSETVETVNISTNAFEAEQGMAGGAAINVITKSGTNEFHGTAFSFHDNNRLQAKNFFTTGAKPKSIRNINGGTAGGAIVKNKLFYFGGWEGNRERLGKIANVTVPTADQRVGDFSAFNTTIFDPLSGNRLGQGRSPFPNNAVPLDRQSSSSLRMLDLVPLPNQAGANANFFSSGTQGLNRDNFDVKINYNRTDSHSIWGKYSLMDAQVECQFALGEAGGRGLCDGGPGVGDTLVQVATIGHTWTLSPNFVWDATIGWTRMGQNVRGPDFGENFGLDVLGIPGTNGDDIRQSGKPPFVISGFETLGNPNTWSPIFRNDQSFTTDQNFSLIKGKHTLRFGFSGLRHHLNHWQPEIGGGPRGRFIFDQGITGLNAPGAAAPTQFNAFAGFLLGLPSTTQKSVQVDKFTAFEWQFAGYIQDRWQLTPKLTLSLGLRYEFYPLFTRAGRGGVEVVDLETNRVFLGGNGNVPKDTGITTSTQLWAPRIGVAYRWNDKTVIRSGYGITYDPTPLARTFRDTFPLVVADSFVGRNSFDFFQPLSVGIPAVNIPDRNAEFVDLGPVAETRFIGGGNFSGPAAFQSGGDLQRGYTQSWNLVVEREMPLDFITSFAYVGTQTVRQSANFNVNAGQIPGAGNEGQPLFAKFGRTGRTDVNNGFLSANYHALQIAFNRRAGDGLFIKGAYTYSRAINFVDDAGRNTLLFNAASEIQRNRGRAGFDQPHNFQFSSVYDLPFAKNSTGVKKWLLADWQLNGLLSMFKGRTFTVTAAGSSLNAPFNTQTADQVKPDVEKFGDTGPGQLFFDTSAFAPVTEARFGNVGRNTMRAPGVVNLDLGLFKGFNITEKIKGQFKAEAFNISNTPHFNAPVSNVSNASFGQVLSAVEDQRQFRFGVKIFW